MESLEAPEADFRVLRSGEALQAHLPGTVRSSNFLAVRGSPCLHSHPVTLGET